MWESGASRQNRMTGRPCLFARAITGPGRMRTMYSASGSGFITIWTGSELFQCCKGVTTPLCSIDKDFVTIFTMTQGCHACFHLTETHEGLLNARRLAIKALNDARPYESADGYERILKELEGITLEAEMARLDLERHLRSDHPHLISSMSA